MGRHAAVFELHRLLSVPRQALLDRDHYIGRTHGWTHALGSELPREDQEYIHGDEYLSRGVCVGPLHILDLPRLAVLRCDSRTRSRLSKLSISYHFIIVLFIFMYMLFSCALDECVGKRGWVNRYVPNGESSVDSSAACG